jgi:hypothetical protein
LWFCFPENGAYYGLFREDLFQNFRPDFLERDIQGRLTAGLFNPVNWFRLASQEYFDAMGSRLDAYPVSRAVAASSSWTAALLPDEDPRYYLVPEFPDLPYRRLLSYHIVFFITAKKILSGLLQFGNWAQLPREPI